MKERPMLLAAVAGMALVGLVFGLLGWLLPGQPPLWEPGVSGGKSVLSESKKKLETMDSPSAPAEMPAKNAHRVFVSRALVFLPKEEEPVQAMKPEMITEDKIQVGWKLRFGFDPEDPDVASRDDDLDGFSNLEEFQKNTDPRDSQSSPSKWVKLRLASFKPAPMILSFAGTAGDRYTLRLVLENRRKDVSVVLGDQLWIGISAEGPEAWKSQDAARKGTEGRPNPHLIPLKILEFKADVGQRLDPRTQIMIDYNDSSLVLERGDGIQETISLLIDERGKARGVTWNMGEIVLASLVPGEGELGPYRAGQIFSYAGRDFLIRDASAAKVSLELLPEKEKVEILPKTP
jgi:hypothetical protein